MQKLSKHTFLVSVQTHLSSLEKQTHMLFKLPNALEPVYKAPQEQLLLSVNIFSASSFPSVPLKSLK